MFKVLENITVTSSAHSRDMAWSWVIRRRRVLRVHLFFLFCFCAFATSRFIHPWGSFWEVDVSVTDGLNAHWNRWSVSERANRAQLSDWKWNTAPSTKQSRRLYLHTRTRKNPWQKGYCSFFFLLLFTFFKKRTIKYIKTYLQCVCFCFGQKTNKQIQQQKKPVINSCPVLQVFLRSCAPVSCHYSLSQVQ